MFLFTSEFPYGSGEIFIQNEIGFLCETFSRVYILPARTGSALSCTLPANVEVIHAPEVQTGRTEKIRLALKHLPLLLFLLRYERRYSRQKVLAFRNRKQNFFLLLSLMTRLDRIKAMINTKHACFYSYWFSNDATILSILKKRGIINDYISRAHGFDLYEDNGKENYLPFRSFQLAMADRVYCVSQTGMKYLQNLYPAYSQKVKYSYLGVHDHGINTHEPKELVIVSCSNIVTVKRLHLLVEALKKVNVKITWFHFGEGNREAEIKKMAEQLPVNVKAVFRGKISNNELMAFYKEQSVSLFVNTSNSEGIPVSIMEAISFGIPVIATDVGGVSEIVTPDTGILLPQHFETAELSSLLNHFSDSALNSLLFREKTRRFFESNFSATENYPNFISGLVG